MIKITRDEAIDRTAMLKPTYMLVQINPSTSIVELAKGVAFFVEPEKKEPELEKKKPKEPPKQEPPKKETKATKKLDHGKICALRKAGWPVSKIADEMGCSGPTVRYHLDKEGIE